MARLIVIQQTSTPKQVALFKLPYLIGRAPSCDLVLDNPQVSRAHAVLEQAGDAIQIRDLGGTNGTYVNGQRVESCALGDGDEVKVGACVIRFLSSGDDDMSNAEALRLVTSAGELPEYELVKLMPKG
jgi:pSer/pThr/pTyr-binding forkhead associated (FHA) protein